MLVVYLFFFWKHQGENVHAHDNSKGVAIKTSLNGDIQSRRSKLFEHQERGWSLFTVL
jgi:hypothetical protein